jgi:cytochrome c biogenesis protein CcmG, thiol:disulfide interchange protein DsbE
MKTFYSFIVFAFVAFAANAQPATLPAVELANLKGEKVDVSKLSVDGKIVVMDFWATWCVPCKKSLTNMVELYPEWQKKYNVEIVAVSVDDARNTAKVKANADGAGWPYTILLDPNQDLKRALNFQNIPYTVVLDKKGNIAFVHQGYVDGDEFVLEEEIKKLAGS